MVASIAPAMRSISVSLSENRPEAAIPFDIRPQQRQGKPRSTRRSKRRRADWTPSPYSAANSARPVISSRRRIAVLDEEIGVVHGAVYAVGVLVGGVQMRKKYHSIYPLGRVSPRRPPSAARARPPSLDGSSLALRQRGRSPQARRRAPRARTKRYCATVGLYRAIAPLESESESRYSTYASRSVWRSAHASLSPAPVRTHSRTRQQQRRCGLNPSFYQNKAPFRMGYVTKILYHNLRKFTSFFDGRSRLMQNVHNFMLI